MKLSFDLNHQEQFLCEVIKHRDFLNLEKLENLFQEIGEEKAFEITELNLVTSIAYDALSLCPGLNLNSKWKEIHNATESRISDYMLELDLISNILYKNNILFVALKNSGIARGLYRYLGASPMGDLDVLVNKKDFRRAHLILKNEGYSLKFRSPLEEDNLELAEQGGGAEYSVNLPSGEHLWFELQWRPVAGRWIRPDQEPLADDLIERSHAIKDTKVRILSPEDNLLQVCLHTAKHTYVRAPGFRLHTDVDRIIRSSDIDWNNFSKLVISLEVRTSVFFSLILAKSLIDTPIPSKVLEAITPNRLKVLIMKKWLEKVSLFDPDGKKWGKLGYIIFVSLMYDDFTGLLKGLFPSPQEMRKKYSTNSNKSLLFLYLSRLIDLVKNRLLVK